MSIDEQAAKRRQLMKTLQERGYFYQSSNKEEVEKLISGEPITLYSGYDPTADSLHIGNVLSLIMLKYFQEAGHKVIILIGGATAMIGDPTGKSEMRSMIDEKYVKNNIEKIKKVVGRFLDLEGENPIVFVNNADWFKGYDYISFMRDIGAHFNVNKMLATDIYSRRLEEGGLTFFEMGYMLMQAYDFVYLNRKYNCRLQVGGSDQWANILAGVDLGRKLNLLEGKDEESFQAFTTPLLLNSEGEKMGKTAKGALWVSGEKCLPYDFYQYFYNVDDNDVENLLKSLTRLSLDEIKKNMMGDIREAKRKMAFEVTKLVHGKKEAEIAEETAIELFTKGTSEDAPTFSLDNKLLKINICELCVLSGLTTSKSEARRLIEQGGLTLNGEKVKSFTQDVKKIDFDENGQLMLKKGKKIFVRVNLV